MFWIWTLRSGFWRNFRKSLLRSCLLTMATQTWLQEDAREPRCFKIFERSECIQHYFLYNVC